MINVPMRRSMNIEITQAGNGGFIVRVGCEQFVFSGSKQGITEMCDEIAAYLQDPKVYEMEFHKQRRHQEERGVCEVAPPPPRNLYEEQAATTGMAANRRDPQPV
jgi:hypothetical protein